MTKDDFLIFYPQFTIIPEAVLTAYVDSASLRFDDFGEDAEEARRLYVAHKLTLYAKTYPAVVDSQGGATSISSLATSGDGSRITSKKVDDVQVTYSSGASSSSVSSSLSDLEETIYGLQLLTLLRIYAYPRYVP